LVLLPFVAGLGGVAVPFAGDPAGVAPFVG
jgi:hypothetical protein